MSRPNISKPTTIRPPFVARTIVNPRVVDSTIIAKLFLICQEGQISNIKDYIILNGLTANNLVNTDGQSILHVILLNDSITPREKIEIFKFLASRNLLKFSYDSQQKTPLHIASEKQLTDIVKILLNASHDVNALDSAGRTPIYYAIVGKEVECPKKQKPLIEQKNTFKLNLQDELNQEIVKFINDNADIKNLLLHLYNTTKNLDAIYYDEITRILEEDNKKIMEILITEKDEEKKKEKIFEKVYDTRNSIINMFVKEKFTSTLKPISFNKVDTNTWGPDTNPVNKFLNDVEPIVILKEFELDYEKQKVITIEDLEKNFSKVKKSIDKLKSDCFDVIDSGLSDFTFYFITYNLLRDATIFAAPNPLPLSMNQQFTQADINQLFEYPNLAANPDIMNFISRVLNSNGVYNLNANQDPAGVAIGELLPNPVGPTELTRNKTENPSMVKSLESFLKAFGPVLNGNPGYNTINGGINFMRKIKVIRNAINTEILDNINRNINLIKNLLQNQLITLDIKLLFEYLVEINLLCISFVNYIILLRDELQVIINKTNKILEKIDEEIKYQESHNITITGNRYQIESSVLYYDVKLTLKKGLSYIKSIDDLINNDYKNIVQLQESLNKSINFINTISATKYIIYFSNELTNFDQIFTTNTTSQIKNLFSRNIPQFSRLYSKFETILSEQTYNIEADKLNMVNKFVPQFNQYNFFSYYQNTVGLTQQPRIGFMVPINYLSNVILNGEPKLTYGKIDIAGEIVNADTTIPDNLLQYRIGVQNPIRQNKTDNPINAINLLLDKHFLIIKNFVIRKLITQLYLILQTKKAGGTTAGKESLETLLEKTYSQIRENLNLPEDNLQLFLIMLAKNIDKILSANLTNFILNGITLFGFREKRHRELKLILDKIANIKSTGATDDNTIQIVHTDLEQLTKPDDIIAVIKADSKAYRIEYNQPVLTEKNNQVRQFKPSGINDINENKCVKTDIELIQLLLYAKASTTGLITQAIESNNVDLVKLLVDTSSVYNEKSRNSNGLRPFDMALSQIKYYGATLNTTMINNLIEDSSTEISKKTSSTFQMRYHEIFYQIFYVLFNHLLLDLTNLMKYDNKKKLRKKLKFTKEAFPMKDYINWGTMIKQIDDDYIEDKTNVINQVVDIESKDNEDKIKMEMEIKNKIKDLQKELNDTEDKPTEIRKHIIEDELRELDAKLLSLDSNDLDIEKTSLEQNKKQLKTVNNVYSQHIISHKIKTLDKEKNFMKMYESLDDTVFGKDIKSVNNVWSSIFKKYKLDDLDMDIISKLSIYIQNESTIEDIYIELKDYLNGIVRFASDYVELEQQLHLENYALEKIYEILLYIIKHTISINLKNIIQQLLRNELTRITPQQTMTVEVYSRFIDEKIKAIFKSSKLDEYINITLPEKLFVTTFNLNITDKTEVQQHFEYITKIISLNGVIPITSDTEIVKTLTNNIFPYFSIYADINLKKIKLLINGIFNILDNLNDSLEIYKIISDKAKTEK